MAHIRAVHMIWIIEFSRKETFQVTYRRSAPIQKYMQHISQTLRRVGKPASQQYQHQLILSPTSNEDREYIILEYILRQYITLDYIIPE